MNERIRQLLLTAMSQSFNRIDRDGDMDKMYIPHVFAEEFTELIVRDVLAQVEEIQRLDNVFKVKVGIDFEIDVAKEVLKNYGVE